MKNVKISGKNVNIVKKYDPLTTVIDIKKDIQTETNLHDINLKYRTQILDDDFTLSNIDSKNIFLLVSEIIAQSSPKKRKLCKNDCGFYGDFMTDYYCSVCYTKIKEQKAEQAACKSEEVEESESSVEEILQKDFTKCWKCSRRIGLLGFECKCKYKFCGMHRYAEQHDCNYNYKKHEIKKLRMMNEGIENQKLRKI